MPYKQDATQTSTNLKTHRLFIIMLVLVACTWTAMAQQDTCTELVQKHKTDEHMLAAFSKEEGVDAEKRKSSLISYFDECLDLLVRSNLFESVKYLIQFKFGDGSDFDKNSGKELSKAQSVVQSAMQYVRSQQDQILEVFENTQQMSSFTPAIPEISPSIRWAQSVNNTFMEVKFSTRFDSPACLDLFDQDISLSEVDNKTVLHIEAMCRNDKKLLKYQVDLDLYDGVEAFTIDPQRQLDYDEAMRDYDSQWEQYQIEQRDWQRQKLVYSDKMQKQADKKYRQENNELFDEEDVAEEGDSPSQSGEGAEKAGETAEKDYDQQFKDAQQAEEDGEEPLEPLPMEPSRPGMEKPAKPSASTHGQQSVGRMYFSLAKKRDSRWKKLAQNDLKQTNLVVWWEVHEKHETALDELEAINDDEEISSSKKKNKKKSKKKKGKKKSKKGKTEDNVDKEDL